MTAWPPMRSSRTRIRLCSQCSKSFDAANRFFTRRNLAVPGPISKRPRPRNIGKRAHPVAVTAAASLSVLWPSTHRSTRLLQAGRPTTTPFAGSGRTLISLHTHYAKLSASRGEPRYGRVHRRDGAFFIIRAQSYPLKRTMRSRLVGSGLLPGLKRDSED